MIALAGCRDTNGVRLAKSAWLTEFKIIFQTKKGLTKLQRNRIKKQLKRDIKPLTKISAEGRIKLILRGFEFSQTGQVELYGNQAQKYFQKKLDRVARNLKKTSYKYTYLFVVVIHIKYIRQPKIFRVM